MSNKYRSGIEQMARKYGFAVHTNGATHLKLVYSGPERVDFVMTGSTPTDVHGALLQTERQVRLNLTRAGIDPDRHKQNAKSNAHDPDEEAKGKIVAYLGSLPDPGWAITPMIAEATGLNTTSTLPRLMDSLIGKGVVVMRQAESNRSLQSRPGGTIPKGYILKARLEAPEAKRPYAKQEPVADPPAPPTPPPATPPAPPTPPVRPGATRQLLGAQTAAGSVSTTAEMDDSLAAIEAELVQLVRRYAMAAANKAAKDANERARAAEAMIAKMREVLG